MSGSETPEDDMTATLTTAQAAAHYGVSLSTIYRRIHRGIITATKIARRWAITIEETTMTQTDTRPIVITRIDGRLTVAGPAEIITAAIAGAAPLTITATGDTVWLAPNTSMLASAVTMRNLHIAHTITHPEHGEIACGWLDETRLDDAPILAGKIAARAQAILDARRAEFAARRPSCDQCGDCARCC
jgi:excisionase family DNA binding protein